MGENVSGIYSILNHPAIFNAFHRLVVKRDARRVLVQEYIKPRPGDRLLDIGCGPASMLPYLEEVQYTGLDLEPNFVEEARAKYGARATFIHARVRTSQPNSTASSTSRSRSALSITWMTVKRASF